MSFYVVRHWVNAGLLAALLAISSALRAFAQSLDTAPALASVDLPRDLSPWGMFVTADILVKAVLIGLVIASLITWIVRSSGSSVLDQETLEIVRRAQPFAPIPTELAGPHVDLTVPIRFNLR
jgi:hypothetical protein